VILGHQPISNTTELIKKLSNENIKNVYVDGGVTIQNFLSCKLVDEITITIFPIFPIIPGEDDLYLDIWQMKFYYLLLT
jgi:riboflavin biosynthesis pyrimidine reductase